LVWAFCFGSVTMPFRAGTKRENAPWRVSVKANVGVPITLRRQPAGATMPSRALRRTLTCACLRRRLRGSQSRSSSPQPRQRAAEGQGSSQRQGSSLESIPASSPGHILPTERYPRTPDSHPSRFSQTPPRSTSRLRPRTPPDTVSSPLISLCLPPLRPLQCLESEPRSARLRRITFEWAVRPFFICAGR
jgi:hypothetical protein